MKLPYVIAAPEYTHVSNGIKVLYKLRDLLEKKGYIAEIVNKPKLLPANYIAIYPETISGNSCYANTVVRYVLNTPGLLGGDKIYDKNEIIFTFMDRFYPNAPKLAIPTIEDFFKNENLERKDNCYYIGKGAVNKVPMSDITNGLIQITRQYPPTRIELKDLFNKCETFYTYDDTTALIPEAKLCGCKVVVIPGERINEEYEYLIKNYESELDNFINITQLAGNKRR